MSNLIQTWKQISSKARTIRLRQWVFPFVLLFICALSYGSMATKLGFYWDDWFITYYTHFFGADIFPQATVIDRPFLGWLYTLIIGLIGESRVGWQIFAVMTRWLLGLSLWWMLNKLWPGKAHAAAAVTLIFVVYPSFQQQHIAITYGVSFLIYSFYFTSIALMLWAQRQKRWFWPLTALALLVDVYLFFTAEYFYGLELLRPAILWVVFSESASKMRQRLRKTALHWSPYALVMLGFTLYRLLNETPRGEITIFNKLSNGPVTALFELAKTIIGDSFMVSVLAWGQTLQLSSLMEYGSTTVIRYALILLLAALLSAGYLAIIKTKSDQEDAPPPAFLDQWGWQAVLLGILALLVAGIPFWMTDLKMSLAFTRDRFTLPMMIGAALLLFGLIEVFTRKRWQSAILIALLVSLASGMHFQNALTYRKEWLIQKDFFWQLVWRAPGIEPGTIILTTDMPFIYNFDGSLTAPLNWIYAPENTTFDLNYLYYDVESHLSRHKPDLVEGMPIDVAYRLTEFDGSLSQAMLVIYTPPGCLKVIDPILDQRLPDKPRYFREALPFSDPSLIQADVKSPAQLPAHIFGEEPEHGWCYYFEKAELARQIGDWQKIAELGDLALKKDKQLYRKNIAELIPFIEGYARSGQWDMAVGLSLDAYQTWENMQLMLCDLWQDINQTTEMGTGGRAAFEKLQKTLKCTAR
ncbi:hypothetical protein ACFLZW_02370 [Chloroflexota bacterium]